MIQNSDGLIYNNDNYFYYSDFEFMFNGVNYEKDKHNSRCYRLEDSGCLRADCDGKLVKKRISAVVYNHVLEELKAMIPLNKNISRI